LIEVDPSKGTKRTPQQDVKSNAAQEDDQHNAALRRRDHKKHKMENLICVKITYLD